MASIDININNMINGAVAESVPGNVSSREWIGTGSFDRLIMAVNKNIELQFDKGRLKGPDYANVYLGGLQAALQTSLEFETQLRASKLSKYPSMK